MKLLPGMPAPSFHAADLFGNRIALADYRGKTLLISFFRNAACAMCNLRVHTLINNHAKYHRRGLAMLAIFESSAESMRQYVGQQDAPFPLIADPAARLYGLYGVENSEEKIARTMALPSLGDKVAAAQAQGFALTEEAGSNFLRMPADFVIDPDGRILVAHYADYVWDHLPLTQVEDLLDVAVPGR